MDGAPEELPLLSKREVADRLLDRIVARLAAGERGAADSDHVAPNKAKSNVGAQVRETSS